MTTVVSKFVIKTVCENQGCLDFERLNERIAQCFTVAEQVLHNVLFDDGKIAIQEGRKKRSGGLISPDSLIVAKTPLRLCQKHEECGQCEQLHLCRYYVCGNCRYGNKCKKSHVLASSYNMDLLKRFGLEELTAKQLFQLLLQNDPSLLPEICPHYNKGNGEHGSCKFKTSCTNLHLCQHFVQGDCKFGTSCKRAHQFDAQANKIFSVRGLSPANIKIIDKIYRNRFIISGPQRQAPAVAALPTAIDMTHQPSSPTKPSTSSAGASNPISEADRNEICLYFIRRHCSFKEKCVRVHYHLPYKWQVLDGVNWKDLPNMEDIEKAYCDPGQDTSCTDQTSQMSQMSQTLSQLYGLLSIKPSSAPRGVQSVDFLTMTYGGSPVRRLSTASSGSKPPNFILTTQWLWYWAAGDGSWLEYGLEGSDDASASVTSQTLENVYLADRDPEIHFGAGKQKYILYFKEMYQQNEHYKTKRQVRRRPRFVSSQEVEDKLKSTSSDSSSSSSTAEAVPVHWDKTALPDFTYKLVPLSNSMKDYKLVEKMFKSTMPNSVIRSMQRIQNPSLWKVFQWQKQQMTERNEGKPVNEQYLFHGTDESLIDAICEQNFDWRVCGVHGTAYGRGSYFAKDASYSDRYASIKSGQNKVMFVALVLVGEYTKGSSSYVRPPAKGTSKAFYDSCVSSESNPSIFVIFDKLQIYPEYIITYS